MRVKFILTSVFIALFILTSGILSFPQGRKTKTIKQDSGKITCVAPPDDVLRTSKNLNFGLTIPKITSILKEGAVSSGSAGVQSTYQRVRSEVTNINMFEVVHYRLCIDYANGAIDKQTYQFYIGKILPLIIGEQIGNPTAAKQVAETKPPEEIKSKESSNREDKIQQCMERKLEECLEKCVDTYHLKFSDCKKTSCRPNSWWRRTFVRPACEKEVDSQK